MSRACSHDNISGDEDAMAKGRSARDANHGERNKRTTRLTGGKANYLAIDAAQLQYTIALVADAGGALRLGYTRDGGAFAIGVYGDGEPYTEYLRPSDDIETYLRELCDAFGGHAGVEAGTE